MQLKRVAAAFEESFEGEDHGGEGEVCMVDGGGVEPAGGSDAVEGLGGGVGGGAGGEEEVEDRVDEALVVIGIGMGAEEADVFEMEADFFCEFALEPVFSGFAFVDEAAGDGEFVFGWVFGAADEEDHAVRSFEEGGGGAGGVEIERVIAGRAVERLGGGGIARDPAGRAVSERGGRVHGCQAGAGGSTDGIF